MSDERSSLGHAELERIRLSVLRLLGGRVRDFRVVAAHGGLVLSGRTSTHYLKQLMLEALMGATSIPVIANRIEVDRTSTPTRETAMPTLRELMNNVLVDGKIDVQEITSLSAMLYADGKLDRREAEFLIELHSRVERVSPGFEKFFYKAIKQHVLTDGVIDAEEAEWLRDRILADGKLDERKKKLLRELRGEAKQSCPAFDALFEQCGK